MLLYTIIHIINITIKFECSKLRQNGCKGRICRDIPTWEGNAWQWQWHGCRARASHKTRSSGCSCILLSPELPLHAAHLKPEMLVSSPGLAAHQAVGRGFPLPKTHNQTRLALFNDEGSQGAATAVVLGVLGSQAVKHFLQCLWQLLIGMFSS